MAKKKILQDNEGQIWPITVADCVYLTDGSKTVKKYIDDALSGKADSSHTHTVLSVKSDNWKDSASLPSTYDRGETLFFSNNPSSNKFNGLTYGMVQTLKEYGSGPAAWQFLYPYNAADDKFYVRNAQYNTDSWRGWAEVYTSLNKPTPAAIGAAPAEHGTHLTIGTGASNAAAGNHTHNYAGSSSAGGAATSANKVNTNLAIKLNGGTTEGTNLFTFNGSAAKTVNITPSSIGAAAAEHGTHLSLGTTSSTAYRGDYGNTAYQHSLAAHAPSNAQKNSDITKAEIEAKLTGAITSHTHDYAPSSHNHSTVNKTFITTPIYNPNNGVLIDFNTNIKSGIMAIIKLYGNSYSSNPPIEAIYQFYDYADGNLMEPSGAAISGPAITLKVFNVDGKLKAWFQQPRDFCTFRLEVTYGNNSSTPNITLTNAAEPTTDIIQTLTINPDRVYSAAYKPTPENIGALSLSGGQMNGPIKFVASAIPSTDATVPTQLAYGMLSSYGNLKILGNTDNSSDPAPDGEYVHIAAGCGLDPESWDGIRVYNTYATCFGGTINTTYEIWMDLTSLDENTWYPVYCKNGIPKNIGMSRIKCSVQLDSGSKPSWSTHEQGFTAILDLMTIGGGWGTADAHCIILNHQAKWCEGNPIGYQNLNNSSAPCFYLRGGGKYRLSTDYRNSGWQIVTTETTINGETMKPYSYNPGLNRWRGGIYADIYGTIGSTLELANNISLCGKNTSGTNIDLMGVDSNNQIYIGWNNQAHINVHNGTTFKNGTIINTGYGNFLISTYGDPFRLEFVPESNGAWDWNNKCYMDNTGQFYASKKLNVAGHRITPYSEYGISIIRPDGQEFSGLEVKELWIGPYSGSTYKFVVSPSAPSGPSYGTVWIQNN